MSKRGSSDRSDTGGKKQRKTITLEEKLNMIKRYEHNEHAVDIVNAMGISESTLRTIRKQADKVKESCKSATRMTASKITQIKASIMEKLRTFSQWIEHQFQCAIPVSTMIIQAKAKTLFDNLNAIEPDPKVPSCAGSGGWFEGHHGFHNLKLTGKCAEADLVAAEKFPVLLQVTIEEHGYLPQQVFSLDDTRLFWKWMLSRTFV
jgi:transposase-like protein